MDDTITVSPLATLTVTVAAVLAMLALRGFLLWSSERLAGLLRRLIARVLGSSALVAARPLYDLAAVRWPRLHRFVHARLAPDHFIGLPLTLLAAAAAYLAALFGGLIDELLEAEEMVAFDKAVVDALDPLRVQPFLDAFLWITDLGASPAVTAVAIVATAFLWIARRLPVAAGLWATLLGSQATTHTGKFLLGRTRPEFLETVTETSASFPSGHTTAAVAVYGFLAYALARTPLTAARRFEIAFWLAVVILLIGFSRIYLRVHYPSDVAGGLLVGGFWLLVGIVVAEWVPSRAVRR